MWTTIISGVTSILPAAINTVSSVVKDKKIKNAAEKIKEGGIDEVVDNVVHKDVASGISISSKRLMNIAGTPTLFYLAYKLLSEGNNTGGIVMAVCAVVYCVGLSYVTKISEG